MPTYLPTSTYKPMWPFRHLSTYLYQSLKIHNHCRPRSRYWSCYLLTSNNLWTLQKKNFINQYLALKDNINFRFFSGNQSWYWSCWVLCNNILCTHCNGCSIRAHKSINTYTYFISLYNWCIFVLELQCWFGQFFNSGQIWFPN